VCGIAAFRSGQPVLFVDGDQDPEQSLPLSFIALSATGATAESINHVLRLSGGQFYVCLSEERALALNLRRATSHNARSWQARVYESFEAVACLDGGISARNRELTVRLTVDPNARPVDVRRPGAVQPLVGASRGTLEVTGYTEAALDLARLAGSPAAVLSEMLDADGRLASHELLQAVGADHGIPIVSVPEIARYRFRREQVFRVAARTRLPTMHGSFEAIALTSPAGTAPYIVLVAGTIDPESVPLVGVFRSCLGSAIRSRACDCRARLDRALRMIGQEDGLIVHLPRPEPHDLQGRSAPPVAIDDAEIAALVLRAVGVSRARLLEDAGLGLDGLKDCVEIVELVGSG
jgi:3,4-dihydroxy 2-butanone 4-phosphate synthase/GTP cyclohydrolase II